MARLELSPDRRAEKAIAWNDPRTAAIRSKTFPGIARAMAEQWGGDSGVYQIEMEFDERGDGDD